MVGQQHQVRLQRPPVPLLRLLPEELVEVTLRRVLPVLRRHRFLPLPQPEKGRQNRREPRRQRDRLVQIRRPVDVEHIRPHRAEHRQTRPQRIQRLRFLRQQPQRLDHLIRQ